MLISQPVLGLMMIARYAAAFTMVVAFCAPRVSAQVPSQSKLGTNGAAIEFRDRMIYEAIAWRDMFDQVKHLSVNEAVNLRNMGRDRGLYAFWEWKAPDTPEPEQDHLLSCRKAAQGARYAVNDYTELLLNQDFNQSTAQWEDNYRLSLSTYTREWSKCAKAFPAAVKAIKKAYESKPSRP